MTNEEIIKHYQDSQVWYSNALEVLRPLRNHTNELIEIINDYNRFAKRMDYAPIPTRKVELAKEDLNKCEEFFTGQSSVPRLQ